MKRMQNKIRDLEEVKQIFKSTCHFSISDIVLVGDQKEKIKNAAEMYAGCVASAIQMEDYLKIIENSGFKIL